MSIVAKFENLFATSPRAMKVNPRQFRPYEFCGNAPRRFFGTEMFQLAALIGRGLINPTEEYFVVAPGQEYEDATDPMRPRLGPMFRGVRNPHPDGRGILTGEVDWAFPIFHCTGKELLEGIELQRREQHWIKF